MCFEELSYAMGELNAPETMSIVAEIVQLNENLVFEAIEALKKGMDIVSDRFDACEYFVGDLIYAGILMSQAENIMRPLIKNMAERNVIGKVIICTVYGDLHDIGKNIVNTVLESRGISTIDMGVDVAPADIVQVALDEDVAVVALSGVMRVSLDSMRMTVEAFKEAGIRDKVRIIVGGACVDEVSFKKTGADAWAYAPRDCADICCTWLK